jgi:hypothetical protein
MYQLQPAAPKTVNKRNRKSRENANEQLKPTGTMPRTK